MKTFMKKRSLLFGVALAAVAALYLFTHRAAKVSDRVESEPHTSVKSEVPAWVAPEIYRRNVGRERPNHERSLRMAESKGWLLSRVSPPRCKVPDEECQEIKSLFDRMADAYDKGLTNDLNELVARMPECVLNVPNSIFFDLRGDYIQRVRSQFLFRDEPLDFNDPKDLKAFMDCNLHSIEILGDFDLRRRDYSLAPWLEAQVVRQLARYRTKFEEAKRHEMASYVDQRLKEWCEKIDSPDGYLHRYMIFQVSLQLLGELDWRWEELLGCIHHEADGLVSAGYRPSWLDEEFPESVEWDRKVAAEHERRRQAARRRPVKNTDDGVRRNGVRQEK